MDLYREIVFSIKSSVRNKVSIFWWLVFPLILASMYYFAFGSLMDIEADTIEVGIEKDSYLREVFSEIEILKVRELENIDQEDIGIIVKEDLSIRAKNKDMATDIVEEIVGDLVSIQKSGMDLASLDYRKSYVENVFEDGNGIFIIFYALIAMVSTYSSYGNLYSAAQSKGDLTYFGARRDISPGSRWIFVIGGFISNILINIIFNIILLLFIGFVLKLDLFTNIYQSILIIILGNIYGASLGMFLGSVKVKNLNITAILTGLNILLSSFAGMTGPDLKNKIDYVFPLVNKLNPIALLTNNLYRVNILDTSSHMVLDSSIMLLYTLGLLMGSYLFLRGKQYDSL